MATIDHLSDLAEDLYERNTSSRLLQSYYDGKHPMPWVHRKAKARYSKLIEQAVSNFPLLIVDSVNDRLCVQGFRLGEQDPEVDTAVWRELWQKNNLDIFSSMVHQQALVTGISYASVWPTEAGGASIRGESSFQVAHECDPGDPLKVRIAMKAWADEYEKKWYLRIFEQDAVTFMSTDYTTTIADDSAIPDFMLSARWTEDKKIDNPFNGVVPIVPFLNRPKLNGDGFSEIGDLLPIFDRINTLTADLLLAAELAAFKIRWATGMEIPRDSTGKAIEPFDVALDRLWVSENPDTKFGSFDQSPLEPYALAIDQAIQQAAAISRTPPFLLLGKLTNLSAEALKATESGLVQKVQNRMRVFGEAWEDVVNLGLMASTGSTEHRDIEVLWRDPENVSEAARVDALVKLSSIGLPWRAVMERWGATPGEIDRWEALKAQDAFEKLMQQASMPQPGVQVDQPVDQNGQPVQQAPDQQAQPVQ